VNRFNLREAGEIRYININLETAVESIAAAGSAFAGRDLQPLAVLPFG